MGHSWLKCVGQLWQSELLFSGKNTGLQGSTLSNYRITMDFGLFELPTSSPTTVLTVLQILIMVCDQNVTAERPWKWSSFGGFLGNGTATNLVKKLQLHSGYSQGWQMEYAQVLEYHTLFFMLEVRDSAPSLDLGAMGLHFCLMDQTSTCRIPWKWPVSWQCHAYIITSGIHDSSLHPCSYDSFRYSGYCLQWPTPPFFRQVAVAL